jgi:molybdate transport system ATP-binding protein
MDKAVGASARALILARDVILATVEPRGLSARNQLPAHILSLSPSGADSVEVKLTLDGGAALTASLTRDSVAELGLAPGLAVWAVIKSVAVEGGVLTALEG